MPRVKLHPEQREALARQRAAEAASEDDVERDIDLARVRDLELAAKLQQIRTDAVTRRGFDAQQATTDAQNAVRNAWNEIAGTVTSPRVHDMLRENFGRRVEVLNHELDAHVGRERAAAKRDGAARLRELAQQDAIDAETALGFATNARTVLNAIDEAAELDGADPAEVRANKLYALRGVGRDRTVRLLQAGRFDDAAAWQPAHAQALDMVGAEATGMRQPHVRNYPPLPKVNADLAQPEFDRGREDRFPFTSVSANWAPGQTASDGIQPDPAGHAYAGSTLMRPASFSGGPGLALDGELERQEVPDSIAKKIPMMPLPPRPRTHELEPKFRELGKPTGQDHSTLRWITGIYIPAARLFGYKRAVTHMAHYLSGSGTPIVLNPDQMRKEIPGFQESVNEDFEENIRARSIREIAKRYKGETISFALAGPWRNGRQKARNDWYYSIGGFDFVHTAFVVVTPGANGNVSVELYSKLDVYDRYQFDQDLDRPGRTKGVFMGPLWQSDAGMARLQGVGWAMRYEMFGSSAEKMASFTFKPQTPAKPVRR